MQHQTQVEQIRRIFRYKETKTTTMADAVYRNNVTDYTSTEQLALERDKLFRHHPLLVGLSCQLREAGAYLTDDFSGVPILVVRSDAGELNALINVCRHRGAKLVEGCGIAKKVFSCPYHAWSYHRDGRLAAIPQAAGFDQVDRDQHGLRRLAVVEKYGMVWVKPAPGEPFEIDDYLAGLTADMAGFALDGYHHYETRVLRRRMNWKLVIDTFLETYHLNVLHRNTVSPILHSNLGAFDGFGRNLRMIIVRRSIDALCEVPECDWDLIAHSAIVYVLFPNTVFIMQGDHLETWRVYPEGNDPDASQMYVSLYTPEPALTDKARRHWDANMDLLLATVENEDFPLGENIQRGFHAGAQDCITYGRNEPSLAHYHTAIKQALGLSPSGRIEP